MDESPKIREGQTAYAGHAVDLRHPVILEDEGRPVAVILPYAEYQRLTVLQEEAKADWRARFRRLLAEVHARTADIPPEEIEADITASFEEMRRDQHGDTSRH